MFPIFNSLTFGKPECRRSKMKNVSQLPENVQALIQKRKNFQAGGQMQRASPGRELGLVNAISESSRIKRFSLPEGIMCAYTRDMRLILLICLLIGFTAWWAYIPAEVTPRVCMKPDSVDTLKAVAEARTGALQKMREAEACLGERDAPSFLLCIEYQGGSIT